MKKEIKEFKKQYGRFFNKVALIDVLSWLEYHLGAIEKEWEEVLKENREMMDNSKKEALAKQKKEYDDYWAHYLIWFVNKEQNRWEEERDKFWQKNIDQKIKEKLKNLT